MASDLDLYCVNHPDRTTRVRCSSCNNPICVQCMRETVVGMKCPSCAKVPARARYGKPKHYLLAVGGGLGVAAVMSAVLSLFRFGFFGFLLPVLIGAAVGEVVRRGSGRRGERIFQAIASATTVVGLALGAVVVGVPLLLLLTPGWLISAAIASLFAWIRAGA